ncbi:MAG: lipid IV(A) palmitoyltransferase PagP [Methylotenera sp.]
MTMLLNLVTIRTSTIKLQQLIAALLMSVIAITTFAEDQESNSVWSRAQDSLSQTWQSTNYELYVPVNAWHNRNYYSSEKIDGYNEHPWGLGVGKYRFDDDGDWNGFYAMAFSDSHRDIEPVVGFGFQKMWRPTDNFRLGAGYTLGLTLREDMHYLPIPVIAPLFSVEYKQLAVQSAYIPGGEGNGNILFTWLRWQLK